MTAPPGRPGASKTRVMFDMTFPDRNRGGSGVYARSLVAALEAGSAVEVREMRSARPGLAPTVAWLARGADDQIRGSNAQILHCPSFVAPWRCAVPYVVTVFDLSTRVFPRDHPLEWRVYERWILPARARAAARVITISDYARRDVVEHYHVDAGRVVTIYPGVDARFHAAGRVADHGAPGEPVMLFPGRPVARKNLDIVLSAMSGAGEGSALRRSRLEISGAAAEEFPELSSRIDRLRLGPRVRWLGHVPPDDMPATYGRADLVVYPSFYEGFGFPPLEAMAVGTPVVASNASCLPEILGSAALLVDPHDAGGFAAAVESALGDQGVRDRLIREGRERAAMFTWERSASRTVELYREVLAAA